MLKRDEGIRADNPYRISQFGDNPCRRCQFGEHLGGDQCSVNPRESARVRLQSTVAHLNFYVLVITSEIVIAMENGMNTKRTNGSSELSKPSIIVPGEQSITLSRFQLEHEAKLLQQKLAAISDFTQQTIAVVLPNSIEVVSLFLAITRQRGIVTLLNPSNKESEFDFYLEDVKSVTIIVPKGAYEANSDSVRAAKRHGSGIAECYWDGQTVVLDIIVQKEPTNGQQEVASNIEPLDTDTALLLHTGGTTGRPKAVGVLFQYIRYLFDASLSGSINPQEP